MTKRAWIVIAIIILIPVIAVFVVAGNFKSDNKVVAHYVGNVDTIEYDGLTLRRVEGEFEYKFKLGEYLGKVGDAFTGTPFYRVADDESDSYYAVAEGGKRILYTEIGELTDGKRTALSEVTRIIFDNFLVEEKDAEDIALITGLSGKRVSVDISTYKKYAYYDLCLSFDGSAIVTEYFGRLICFPELECWVYVSPEEREKAEEKYGEKIKDAAYTAVLIESRELDSLLDSYFKTDTEENQ